MLTLYKYEAGVLIVMCRASACLTVGPRVRLAAYANSLQAQKAAEVLASSVGWRRCVDQDGRTGFYCTAHAQLLGDFHDAHSRYEDY